MYIESRQEGSSPKELAAFLELPVRLMEAGYDQSIVESVQCALTSGELILIDLRLLLEKFFRFSAQMDKAVRFSGDLENFGHTLDFAGNRKWLTEAEKRFVSALYGLLSDSAAHTGPSVVEPHSARHAVLYALWLVLNRFEVRINRPFAGYGGSAGRLRLADQFLKGIRTGVLKGPAFDIDFDQDLMQLTRQRLRYSDIAPLMRVIKSNEASPHSRAICASLILSPRCYRKPVDDNWASTIFELDRYCCDYMQTLPWQLSRCIALALANRTNHPDRLLDYLYWISYDSALVEENLADSDKYYDGFHNATEYYMSRIRNADIPMSGCVWEVYYVSRRNRKPGAVKRILKRRLSELAPGRLRLFFKETADSL